MSEVGTREVALIGGEAHLRSDWDVIARAITDRGMLCSMVSGGRGLTPEIARRAQRAGVVNVVRDDGGCVVS